MTSTRKEMARDFKPYRIVMEALEQFRFISSPMPDFNLLKIGNPDENSEIKAIDGVKKAFKTLGSDKVRDIGNFVTEPFRSKEEKAFKAAIRCAKYVQEHLGKEVHEIPSHLIKPIFEGLSYGNEDRQIQEKFEYLLARTMSGEEIRKRYITYVDSLEPLDAKILDLIYTWYEFNIDDRGPIELLEDQPKGIPENLLRSQIKRKFPHEILDSFTESIEELELQGLIITSSENELIKCFRFTRNGLKFMNLVSNPPSDTTAQTSAN